MKANKLLILISGAALSHCSPTESGPGWPQYRGDLSGTGYSELSQVNAANVGNLALAWDYELSLPAGDETRRANSQVTPVVVDNRMYLPAAGRVVALDPVTGDQIWSHDTGDANPSRRGVSYWPGSGNLGPRIYFTSGDSLHALDAETGTAITDFGNGGVIALGTPYNSVPLVYENIIVVGANTPRGQAGGIGNPRAFDAVSGDALWEFSSVAQPGDPANATWDGDSWVDRLGANAWPFYFTVDTERELLYVPLASPIPFAYGGDRAGSNLYANSIVALHIRTGEYAWHYQTIHHDLWDHDPPAPPTLFDIGSGEQAVPALAVTTKSGYLFLLNRESGEPLYEIEERVVPASLVPGEDSYSTQPIPVSPPAIARVGFGPGDLVTAADTNAEHAQACAELLASMGDVVNQGAYTPWVLRQVAEQPVTTLLFPGLGGGPNWGGAAFDQASGMVFVMAADIGTFGWLESAGDGSELPYQLRTPRPSGFDVAMAGSRWPCHKPPWGRLTAVDTASGDIVWQQPLGITEGLPADRQRTGRAGRAGAVVTASGLLFIAATDDNRLRALRVSDGEELWQAQLPARGNANPLTYLGSDGRQYIAIAATEQLLSFALP